MASCNWRDDPESPVGKRVLLINPKVEVPSVEKGCPKFVWFNKSKASARNCQLRRSESFVFLIREKSKFEKPGPITTFRPKFPNLFPGSVSTVRFWTYVINVAAPFRAGLKPVITGPVTLGRTVANPVSPVFEVRKLM